MVTVTLTHRAQKDKDRWRNASNTLKSYSQGHERSISPSKAFIYMHVHACKHMHRAQQQAGVPHQSSESRVSLSPPQAVPPTPLPRCDAHQMSQLKRLSGSHCGMQRNSIQKAAKRSSNTCTCTDCYGFRKFLQFWHGHYKITGKWQVSIFPALSKQKPQNSTCFDNETIQMHTSAANSKVFLACQFDNVFKYK